MLGRLQERSSAPAHKRRPFLLRWSFPETYIFSQCRQVTSSSQDCVNVTWRHKFNSRNQRQQGSCWSDVWEVKNSLSNTSWRRSLTSVYRGLTSVCDVMLFNILGIVWGYITLDSGYYQLGYNYLNLDCHSENESITIAMLDWNECPNRSKCPS